MPEIQAVVFDLDDTLIDWWGSWTRCVESIADDRIVEALAAYLREHCWQVRPGTEEFVWHRNTWMVHSHRHDIWQAALPWLDDNELAAIVDRFDEELWVGFFPDTICTLEHLADRFPLGVVSNNPHLPAEVERLRLDRWFDLAMVATPEPKPHPAPFQRACEELRSSPASTVFVGDSVKADVLGALAAGLVPVWVDRWDDLWPDQPDEVHRIRGLGDLPRLLERLDTSAI